MATGLVIYYSRSGNTKQMAELITDAMTTEGLKTSCKDVADVTPEDLIEADAIVVGSPTYYGHMSGEIKKMFDDSVKKHGKLDGKIGGAFASSVNIGGGNESTIMGIIECMLIHGMVIQGDAQGDHYGPVSIGKPDDRVISQCKRRGQRIAQLTLKLLG